jgi:N-acetylneuraminate synthase
MSDLFRDLFIFEIANNHQGSVEHGLKIIREMAKIARNRGIKAGVKFQYRNLDSFIHPNFKERRDIKHIPRFLDTRLTKEQFLTLVTAVRNEGMITIATPFDEESVGQCLDQGIEILKVASSSADDWHLLEVIAAARRPVIVSTGGLSIYNIDKVVSFLQHRTVSFALMHCVSIYPTPNSEIQMAFMERMIRRYRDILVGYSGHEASNNYDVVKVAIAKGAAIVERHVGVANNNIKLNDYSMTPEQTDQWVANALTAKEISGSKGQDKKITQQEVESLLSLKRGTYLAVDVKAGDPIEPKDVFFAMPCTDGQITSGEFSQYRAIWKASRDYTKGEPLLEHRHSDLISTVREIIHDAKGMLYEAQIEIGTDFEIELSHHYGLAHFRNIGALIINIVNREYCKKLVVVLSGQRHPNHRHKLKEETFQLLWGDLEVIVGSKAFTLKPGDQVLIERGMWHSFLSRNGAVFEEISTTHHRGDSEYEENDINIMDPLERKTILEDW